ncbi:MAG: DUF481 domain-containing protein [Gemmatimonadetes bacterium]|nr:DUF481 domain-containing protein [Gemmatimonadota bacterium]
MAGLGDYLFSSQTSLRVVLTRRVALQTSYQYNYDSSPPRGSQPRRPGDHHGADRRAALAGRDRRDEGSGPTGPEPSSRTRHYFSRTGRWSA